MRSEGKYAGAKWVVLDAMSQLLLISLRKKTARRQNGVVRRQWVVGCDGGVDRQAGNTETPKECRACMLWNMAATGSRVRCWMSCGVPQSALTRSWRDRAADISRHASSRWRCDGDKGIGSRNVEWVTPCGPCSFCCDGDGADAGVDVGGGGDGVGGELYGDGGCRIGPARAVALASLPPRCTSSASSCPPHTTRTAACLQT